MKKASAPELPVMHGRLADKLYEDLLAWITHEDLKEGAKLPSEKRLAEQFGVSRPVVRQALLRLRSDEIILSRHGSGSYIRRRPKKEFFDFAPIGSVAELVRCFEYRIALEGEAAWLAARRRTNTDLKRIGDALREMDNAVSSRALATGSDLNFHNAIATATKNDLFVSTMKSLSVQIQAGMKVARTLSLRMSLGRLQLVQQEHLAIYKAIEAQDPAAARERMREHIDNARTRLLTDSVEPDPGA